MSQEQEQLQESIEPTKEELDRLIRNHVLGSMGFGLVPIPIVDFIGVTSVQLNLLRKLALAYNTPFSRDRGKSLIAALVGGGMTVPVGFGLASLLKAVPVIGATTGAIALPATAGGMTYAVGKVFSQHFSSGGTMLNFNPEQVKEYYREMFQEGKSYSEKLQPAKAKAKAKS